MATVVTKQTVFKAADAISAAGGNPTQEGVRMRIGGGSFTAIGPFLKEWKEAQAESQALRETPLPDVVHAVLLELAGRLWREAENQASIEVAAKKRDLEVLQQNAKRAELEAESLVRLLERERDDALADRGKLADELAGERKARASLELKASSASKDAAVAIALQEARAEAAEAALAKTKEEVAELRRERDELREANVALREQVAAATAERDLLNRLVPEARELGPPTLAGRGTAAAAANVEAKPERLPGSRKPANKPINARRGTSDAASPNSSALASGLVEPGQA